MKDSECVGFLQWALPRLRLHWPGFRKVRRQVCKRIDRRLHALALTDVTAYRAHLDAHPEEWPALAALCSIPISRFWRDAPVFESLGQTVLPALVEAASRRDRRTVTCWSAGCASGEEPYSLAILWGLQFAGRWPGIALHVLATDVDGGLLERARQGCYRGGSLRELPAAWRAQATELREGLHCVRPPFRTGVEFAQQDIRQTTPDADFDLILCRNAVLTYFEPDLQSEIMQRMLARLRPGGALVVGLHERLPDGLSLSPWPGARAIYRK
jgi:chemotaxis protein methyltransferase CheR